MTQIKGYHAHVYFDANTREKAQTLCETIRDTFDADMGRIHERAVGPHPMWSCQLAFGTSAFADIMPWLALNRNGLIIFTHPNTGDDLADHRDHAIWMGGMPKLKLDMLET